MHEDLKSASMTSQYGVAHCQVMCQFRAEAFTFHSKFVERIEYIQHLGRSKEDPIIIWTNAAIRGIVSRK